MLSFMANFLSVLESSLAHRPGRCQPSEEDNSSSDHSEAGLSGPEQDTASEVRNAPALQARAGRVK